MTHLTFDRISEIVDSRDPTSERGEPHLSECAECRATLEAFGCLSARRTALPRDVAPPPELWNELRSRVAIGRPRRRWISPATPLPPRPCSFSRARGSAARRGHQGEGGNPPPPELVAVDMSYINTVDELRQSLDHARRTMSPAAASAVDRSLGVVDTAIDETRKALFYDPSNQALADSSRPIINAKSSCSARDGAVVIFLRHTMRTNRLSAFGSRLTVSGFLAPCSPLPAACSLNRRWTFIVRHPERVGAAHGILRRREGHRLGH